MKVRLLFFAVLRDIVGKTETELDVPEGTCAADVWRKLRAEYPKLAAYVQPPMTAVNETYVRADAPLHHGDELAFIPPVAGG